MNNEESSNFVSAQVATSRSGISASTLRVYANRGIIRAIRTPGGHRRYCKFDVHMLGRGEEPKRLQKTQAGIGAIYARVSSKKQEDDLQRQIEALQSSYPEYKVFSDT